jgi:GNAT superfamily N-acetyltransferase
MALKGELTDRGARVDLHPVQTESDWQALLSLLIVNHGEGRASGNLDLPPAFSASMLSGFRAKGPNYKFYLAMSDGAPAAYGACAKAPNGAGMIEDLFTLPSARRRGIATGMIAAFTDRLRASGCQPIFLGALANDQPKRLYARLGFRPITLARAWVRNDGSAASKSVLS